MSPLHSFESFQFGTFKVDANGDVFNGDGGLGMSASETP